MRKMMTIAALLTSTAAVAYDGGGSGWKKDGDKIAVDDAGNPIFIATDGREMTVRSDTVVTLQNEAKNHRIRAEAAEAKLVKFDGIADPEAAKKALETVGKLDAKQLIDAGKVDEVRAEITKQYEQRLADSAKLVESANAQISNMRLDTAFNSSEFARNRLTVPVEMVRATFGDRFKDDGGKIVATGADGNPIYSKKNVGELADFDEALSIIVENYKHKDTILKAPDASGSGNNGNGGNRGQGRTFTRKDFEALPPSQQAEIAAKAGSGEVSIVD